MPAKKLVVSTYLQYVLIGAAVLVLFAFVRQLSGVLLTSRDPITEVPAVTDGGKSSPGTGGKEP